MGVRVCVEACCWAWAVDLVAWQVILRSVVVNWLLEILLVTGVQVGLNSRMFNESWTHHVSVRLWMGMLVVARFSSILRHVVGHIAVDKVTCGVFSICWKTTIQGIYASASGISRFVEATATVLVSNYAWITHDCIACWSWDINSVTLPQSLLTEKGWRVIFFGFVLRWVGSWLALVSTAVGTFHLQANGWLLGQRMISYYRIRLKGLTRGMAARRKWLIQQCLTACWLSKDKSVE